MESLLPYKDICDADITKIEQCAEGIKLHITNVVHDDAYYNVVLALFADSCDVNYYYCKQYPRCHSIMRYWMIPLIAFQERSVI